MGERFFTPAPRMASLTSSLGIEFILESQTPILDSQPHSLFLIMDELTNGNALETLLSGTPGKTHALVMFTGEAWGA